MSATVQVSETPTQVLVSNGEVRIVAAETPVVRVVSAGVQGPPGGSGPLRAAEPAWAPAMTLNWSSTDLIRITLEGDTILTFTGGADGQRLLLELTQDANGLRSVTWPANLRYSTSIPAIALSNAPGRLDRVGFLYRAASNTYDVIALALGFI